MLVTDDELLAGRDLVEVCQAAVRGGVTSVQLRLKRATPRELVDLARRLKSALPVPVIVNDRPDVARVAGCWVHVGPGDLPVQLTRRLFPPGDVIGASVGSTDEITQADDADYWGVGPLNGTATKSDAGHALGLEGFRGIVTVSKGRPCVAIGGVRPQDVGPVLAAGGVGVAVVSGVLGSTDIEAAVRGYAREF